VGAMQRPTRVGRHHSPAQRDRLVAQYRRSGLTQRQFAAKVGIGYSTLTLWLRKAAPARKPSKSGFVAVPNLLSSTTAPAYRLRFSGGISVEVASGFRSEELASLLEAVQRL
jgi:transposase-like protein